LKPFPEVPAKEKQTKVDKDGNKVPTTSSRYECTFCHQHFCIDCDLFAHEVVHNCAGCQSQAMQTSLMGETETGEQNGQGNGPDTMDLD
jgi:transcription initiation factor TFIIH subunit 2